MALFCRTVPRAAVASFLLGLLSFSAAHASDVRTIEIEATEFSFEPAEIEVEKGETVRLKLMNRGSLSHNIHIEGAPINTETVQGGSSDTVEFTASQDGSIRFFCNVPGHKQAGMTGDIVVE
jgi:uncharacterized cupredoxin-like copper-binding protein